MRQGRPTSPLSGHLSKNCSASSTIIWTYVFIREVFRDSAKKRNCTRVGETDQTRQVASRLDTDADFAIGKGMQGRARG